MIAVPLIMYPLMGLAVGVSTEAVQGSIGTGNFVVMDLDDSDFSHLAVHYFASVPNVTVNLVQRQGIDTALKEVERYNATTLVVIPAGFGDNITSRRGVSFETYTPLKTFGVAEAARANIVSGVLASFGNFLSAYYIQSADPTLNASVVMHPLSILASSYVNGELLNISPATLNNVMIGQSFAMPIAVMIVVILAMQIAATAIAVEKEQKTLETLLTLPVSRFNILAAKLLGSTVIAGLGAIASVIGFTYYINSFVGSFGSAASVGFNLSPSPLYYIILGGLIFLTLALSTSMAMVIGVFADDVRGAQAVVGYLILPVMIPSFMVMLGDLQSFPADLQAALLAIPFTYAASFAKMAFVGDFTIGVLGLAYILFWTVVVLYIGSRLFSSEKILTVRFSFGRKKKASSPE
jgi:ABC-2 type transport system permease protein